MYNLIFLLFLFGQHEIVSTQTPGVQYGYQNNYQVKITFGNSYTNLTVVQITHWFTINYTHVNRVTVNFFDQYKTLSQFKICLLIVFHFLFSFFFSF